MNAIHQIEDHRLTRARVRHASLSGSRRTQPGFTITEMLVVVGIIVLLASLLMVAMGRVRNTALQSQTLSIMQNFAAACDAFQTEHGMYPGVIPERVLATEVPTEASIGEISFTSTENALLHLMGGYRVLPPGINAGPMYDEFVAYGSDPQQPPVDYTIVFGQGTDQWQLKIRLADIGQGPIINGKPYASYYTPGTNEVGVVEGQVNASDALDTDDWVRIPDLIDAWGQPILYVRQIRTTGPLVGDQDSIDATNRRPQFLFGTTGGLEYGGMSGYLLSQRLGELATDQQFANPGNPGGSILTDPAGDRLSTFAQIIRHPAFGEPEEPLSEANVERAAARGAYALISAGPDGIFFSAIDGPGTDDEPVTDIVSGQHGNPSLVEEYDDVVFFGGG